MLNKLITYKNLVKLKQYYFHAREIRYIHVQVHSMSNSWCGEAYIYKHEDLTLSVGSISILSICSEWCTCVYMYVYVCVSMCWAVPLRRVHQIFNYICALGNEGERMRDTIEKTRGHQRWKHIQMIVESTCTCIYRVYANKCKIIRSKTFHNISYRAWRPLPENRTKVKIVIFLLAFY